MDNPGQPDPQIRFFVACPRSGSTLLMRIFAESPVCAVTSRLILMGHAGSQESFQPDYSILQNPSDHAVFRQVKASGKQFLINKEELGNDRQKGECQYAVFPTPSVYSLVRPVFLIRDPIRVFDSWKKVGWTDLQSLIDCYMNLFQMLQKGESRAISCLVYEQLIRDPHREVKRICARWGLPFSEEMLQFKQNFGSSFLYASTHERENYCSNKPLGLFSTVEASLSVVLDVPCHGLLSNNEKDEIEQHVGRLYLGCWQEDVSRLRASLTEKTWIGFDLDDTLHEFRRASGAATKKTLEAISLRHGTHIPALQAQYSKILKEKTSGAFSEGKTSSFYRKERFSAVLTHFDLPADTLFLAELLQLYETTLKASLELKCGALGLLAAIKKLGKKIVVITEGPQDAQEWTLQNLGIAAHIDFLATTAHFGTSKTEGLFARVLGSLSISAADIAYVGDNAERDMEPAVAEGIFCVHYAEAKHVALDIYPPQVNTLRKLEYIISERD